MKRIFSGIQPTGNLHLGNYLGAIRNWVTLQSSYQSIFCIVDLHAITLPQDPVELQNSIRKTAAAYIASGIDPQSSIIFNQSAIAEHSELAWILSCLTPLGWLNRMTQFKEKAGKDKEKAALGLYSYPVLMAADILLYQADIVPVGEDQKQHLELTRDIAGAFNRFTGQEYFTLPEPIIQGEATRIKSLRDGTKKMSKSDNSDYSRINLSDEPDVIIQKFKKAKSDAGSELSYEPEARPEVANLINIYAALSGTTTEQIVHKFAGQGFSIFKQELAELTVEKLSSIKAKMIELENNRDYLEQILKQGALRAKAIASKTIEEVKDLLGLVRVSR
jgi:tryptophanyl-tRNA synthetase